MKQEALNITGYADQFSVMPGEQVKVMVSTTSKSYKVNVVRLCGGLMDAESDDLPVETVQAECNRVYPGRVQEIEAGSYGELPVPSDWMQGGEFTVQLWAWPTLTTGAVHPQTLWSVSATNGTAGGRLVLEQDGQLALMLTDCAGQSAVVRTERPLMAKSWYFIAVRYSAESGEAALLIDHQDQWMPERDRQFIKRKAALDFSNLLTGAVVLAAQYQEGRRQHYYNGKLENPRFFRTALDDEQLEQLYSASELSASMRAECAACYDFSQFISSSRLIDCSGGQNDGRLYQAPARAVTSHNWTGEYASFKEAPDQYAAVHFHDDDLCDAGWDADFVWKVPDELRSGVYAFRLETEVSVDYVPLFVRPGRQTAKAEVVYLAPTNTYLAYANERLYEQAQAYMGDDYVLPEQDLFLSEHPELGKSIYDLHNDGSGVQYSSRLRPILNIRPHYRNWRAVRHFSADLYITGWLERRQQPYDVITDEDLHWEGQELLASYKVIITGSHPEYWTRPMLIALKQYLAAGGRLMYLGGNGFYWVTSLDADRSYLLEVRRGNAGTRSSDTPPGQIYHSTTGEPGGLWRHYGFVPQSIVGVGFSALGGINGCGYKRLPDSHDPAAAFIFEGIGEDEIIGDFGLVMGGAVGDEIDRFDHELGTPKHALRLATSTGLDDYYQVVHEDLLFTAPGQGGLESPLVRADMTYFDIAGGGAVFSVGSINWAGSMAWNNYDNNVVRISDNVLRRFLS